MSVGTLLRPPPWSRSIRELTTTPDGVNAHAFDPDAAAHIKLVVRNGSVPRLRVYASRAECEHDEEGGVAAAEGLFVEDAGDHCAHGEVDIVQVDILPGTLSSDNRVVTEEVDRRARVSSRRRDERADARDVHVLRRGGGRAGVHVRRGPPQELARKRTNPSRRVAASCSRRLPPARRRRRERAARCQKRHPRIGLAIRRLTATAIATAAAARLTPIAQSGGLRGTPPIASPPPIASSPPIASPPPIASSPPNRAPPTITCTPGTASRAPPGGPRPAGDDPSPIRRARAPLMSARSSGACGPCATGRTRPAGDDPSGVDTTCACAADERVSSGACVACATERTRTRG